MGDLGYWGGVVSGIGSGYSQAKLTRQEREREWRFRQSQLDLQRQSQQNLAQHRRQLMQAQQGEAARQRFMILQSSMKDAKPEDRVKMMEAAGMDPRTIAMAASGGLPESEGQRLQRIAGMVGAGKPLEGATPSDQSLYEALGKTQQNHPGMFLGALMGRPGIMPQLQEPRTTEREKLTKAWVAGGPGSEEAGKKLKKLLSWGRPTSPYDMFRPGDPDADPDAPMDPRTAERTEQYGIALAAYKAAVNSGDGRQAEEILTTALVPLGAGIPGLEEETERAAQTQATKFPPTTVAPSLEEQIVAEDAPPPAAMRHPAERATPSARPSSGGTPGWTGGNYGPAVQWGNQLLEAMGQTNKELIAKRDRAREALAPEVKKAWGLED